MGLMTIDISFMNNTAMTSWQDGQAEIGRDYVVVNPRGEKDFLARDETRGCPGHSRDQRQGQRGGPGPPAGPRHHQVVGLGGLGVHRRHRGSHQGPAPPAYHQYRDLVLGILRSMRCTATVPLTGISTVTPGMRVEPVMGVFIHVQEEQQDQGPTHKQPSTAAAAAAGE